MKLNFPMKTFFATLAAIVAGVIIFAPGKLPAGNGLKPLPMEVGITYGSSSVAVFRNNGPVSLHNVKITSNSASGKTNTFFKETWEPNESYEAGPLPGWVFESRGSIDIAVSGYLPRSWDFTPRD